MTSLQLANCSMFVPRLIGLSTVGDRAFPVAAVLQSNAEVATMTAGVVDRESWRPTEWRR